MSAIYVLIMLWGGSTSQSGIAVVQQEFNSLETCVYAMNKLSPAHGSGLGMNLRAFGCFKK